MSTANTSRLGRIARPRLYEQLVEQLIQFIETESLGVGSRLPPERELAEQLGVSRATLSQALVALEVLGVIEVHHGMGATVISRPSLASVLRELREHSSRLPDIIEARRTIEVKLAEFAALRRTDEDMKNIDEALEAMADEIAGGARGLHGDELFHGSVTTAAHSPVLAQLMGLIYEGVLESRIESLGQPGRPQQSLKSHQKIADAIRRQDPQDAAASMDNHLHLVSEVALLSEPGDSV